MTFRVVVTGYNCERWAAYCLQSIAEATRQHTVAVYVVDDGSTDRTFTAVHNFLAVSDMPNVFYLGNAGNQGAAFSRFAALQAMAPVASDEDVVLFIDMDDYILPHCLDVVATEYAHYAHITYGNWLDAETGAINPLQWYAEDIAANGRFKEVPFHATAPRTCLWRLAKQLVEADFIYEGQWLQTCTDVALMWALFTKTDYRHIRPIAEPIYVYRQNTGQNSIGKFGYDEKMRVAALIQQRFYENNPYYSA